MTCPNDCSKHGECNFDGVCECEDGYEGEDCSDSCDRSSGTALGMGEFFSALTTDKHGKWSGNVEVEGGASEVYLTMGVSSGDELRVLLKRGCNPREDDYDNYFSLSNDASEMASFTRQVTHFCPEDEGVLYVSIQCVHSSSCSFDLQFSQIRVVPLEPDTPLEFQRTHQSLLYAVEVHKGEELSVQVTSSSRVGELELLPGLCPNKDMFLASIQDPAALLSTPQGELYVLEVQENEPDAGTWYVRYEACAYANPCPAATFTIVASTSTCSSVCADSFCSSSGSCACDQFTIEATAARPLQDDRIRTCASFSSQPHAQPSSPGGGGNDVDWTTLYIVAGVLGGVLLLVAVGAVLFAVLWQKRKPSPTLYNMLTEEGDDLM